MRGGGKYGTELQPWLAKMASIRSGIRPKTVKKTKPSKLMKRKTLLKTKKTLKKKTQMKRVMEFSSACRVFYHDEHSPLFADYVKCGKVICNIGEKYMRAFDRADDMDKMNRYSLFGSILVYTVMELAEMYSTILSEDVDTMRTMYTGNPDTTIKYIRIFLREMATVLQKVETDTIAPGEEDMYYGFIGDVVTEVRETVDKYKSELKATMVPAITIPKIPTIIKSTTFTKPLLPIAEEDDLLAEFSKLGI